MGQVFPPLCAETGLTNIWGCFFNPWHTRNSALKFLLHVFIYMCAMIVWGGQMHMWRWEDKLWALLVLSSSMWPRSHPLFFIAHGISVPLNVVQISLYFWWDPGLYIFNPYLCYCTLTDKRLSVMGPYIYIKFKGKRGAWWHTFVSPALGK